MTNYKCTIYSFHGNDKLPQWRIVEVPAKNKLLAQVLLDRLVNIIKNKKVENITYIYGEICE